MNNELDTTNLEKHKQQIKEIVAEALSFFRDTMKISHDAIVEDLAEECCFEATESFKIIYKRLLRELVMSFEREVKEAYYGKFHGPGFTNKIDFIRSLINVEEVLKSDHQLKKDKLMPSQLMPGTSDWYKATSFLHKVRIIRICDELETIFQPINSTICANCPNPISPFTDTPNNNESVRPKINGCCTNCASTGGYWYKNYVINYLKKRFGFDNKFGFFDDTKKCCILPRANRSSTCLGYRCGVVKSSPLFGSNCDKLVGQLYRSVCFHRDHLYHNGVNIRAERYTSFIEKGTINANNQFPA
jgi:hypothetical protein